MIDQGRKFASWGENIYVKLPIVEEGIKALKVLASEGIPTNMTLCFSVAQAWAVAKLGATLVSPFIGRLDDIGQDGVKLVEDIVNLYRLHGYETAVLAASIRSVDHIHRSALVGADIVTLPPKLIDDMLHHDLTDKGLAKFMEDFKIVKNSMHTFQKTSDIVELQKYAHQLRLDVLEMLRLAGSGHIG